MEVLNGQGCEPDKESNLLGEDFGSWLDETANFDGEFESIVSEFGGLVEERKLNVSTPNNQVLEEGRQFGQESLGYGPVNIKQEKMKPMMRQEVVPRSATPPQQSQMQQQQQQQQPQMQAYMQPVMQMVPYSTNMGQHQQAQQQPIMYQMPMYYPPHQQQQPYPYMVPYMMPYMPQAVYTVPQQAQPQTQFVQPVVEPVTPNVQCPVRPVVAGARPQPSEPLLHSENKTPMKTEIEKSSNLPRKTSKYRGVSWHKRDKVWLARAWLDGKVEHLGCFRSELMAALVVDFRYEGHRADSSLNFVRKEREKIIEQLKASGEFNVPLFVQNQLKRKHSNPVDEVSGPPSKTLKSS